MTVIKFLAEVGVLVSLGYYIGAIIAAYLFSRRASAPAPELPKIPPRVAVLKPLHGLSKTLPTNLISYLELAYPRVEFLFGVSSYDDPAAQVPVSLRPTYQFANLTMLVGEEPNCANRKIAKVIRMAERADKADIFVLSDADVSVERDHLRRVVSDLLADDKVGVVTCVYRARPLGSLASRLEALSVNTDFAPQAIFSAAVEPLRHGLGATIAIKRPALDSVGCFRSLKDLLADDFYLGRLATEHGWKMKLASSVVTITCEEEHFEDFWNHQLRWARTYRTVRPESLATLAIHGTFWALLLVIASGASPFSLAALAAVLATRYGMSAYMLARVLKLPELLGDVWLVPFKDLVMTGIWFASLISKRVRWAGRSFEILRGGVMREVKG